MDIQPEEYVDQFRVLRMIGEGGQANVYLGTKENQTFALKIYSSGVAKEAAYKIEVELLSKLDHPNIIRIVDHRPQAKLKFQHKNQEKRPLVVLELAEGGELFDYISKTGRFSPDIARTYIKQLISAVQYLSQKGITHRDLKPQNILFDSKFNLKVSDFGLARNAAGQNGDGKLKSRVGTEGYKAPQIQEEDYDGTKVDVFAIGVILFIMYTGSPPFLSTKSHDRIYRLIREKKYQKFWELHQKNKTPNFFSESFKRLINSLISAEPDRRPSFEDLQDDQWLGEIVLTPNQLQNEMLLRANQIGIKIAEKQNVSVKINQITVKKGCRNEIDLQSEQTTKQDVLSYHYHNCHIDSSNLIELQKKGINYTLTDPKLIYSMINGFLFEQKKANTSFLQNFVEQITFVEYSLEYTAKNAQFYLTLCFQIQKEDQVELVLLGNMYKNKSGEIGIQWSKKQGNSYWLASIEAELTKCLSSL